MAPDQDHAVLPEGGDLSSSSQDDEEEDDVVDEDDEDEDDDDVINSESPSSNSASLPVAIAAPPTVTVALPAPTSTRAVAPTATAVMISSEGLDPKRPRTIQYDPVLLPMPAATEEKKPAAALDDSRRLFQRLWTDEDEIELLQGFLDYTTQRGSKGGGGAHQNDTALFYDQIKSKLQLEFNKNQLVEKLRRLKKKYRNVLNKIAAGKEVSFKSPHDQATFEISRKIWSNIGRIGVSAAAAADDNALDDEEPNPSNSNFNNYEIKAEDGGAGFHKSTPRSRKRQRPAPPQQPKTPSFVEPAAPVMKENHHIVNNGAVGVGVGGGNSLGNCNVQGMIEETVKSCLSPLLRELLSNSSMGVGVGQSRGFGGLSLNPIPLSFGGPSINLNFGGGEAAEEQWRKQQILELEVYSKRLELVQNQIKIALDELRSSGGGG